MYNKYLHIPLTDCTYIVVLGGNNIADMFEHVGHSAALLLIRFAARQFTDTLVGLSRVFHSSRCSVAVATSAICICIGVGVAGAQLQCVGRLWTT